MPTTNATSVLVIDHNPILLEGISYLIRNEPDMTLVGTASNLQEGLALAGHARPDCVLLDLDIVPTDGFNLSTLRDSNPAGVIIGLITYELDDRVPDALASGAFAVLGKDQLSERLIDLIRRATRAR